LVQKRILLALQTPVAYSAAENLSQHVAATFIGRQDAVADKKRSGPRVVSDDAEARVL
jgi:hypothetical protein